MTQQGGTSDEAASARVAEGVAPVGAADAGDLTRILVGEDEHLVAASLADNLRSLGYEVVGPAANGQQVVDIAKAEQPQLALLDIRMPQMDGLDAAVVLHQMRIPAVMVSAYSDAEYLDKSARIGVFGYVLKPVTVEDLRVNIAVAWARFCQQDQLRSEVADLKTALENRKLIERAKGLLMQRLELTEPEAMKRLQKQARDSRRSMADLSRAIIETDQLFGDQA